MGKAREIPLTSSTSEGNIAGNDILINVYPRQAIGGKYPFTLMNTPGLAYFCELPTFPVKGFHQTGNRAFAVTRTKFYEVFKDGTFTELGDVDISGRAVIEDNGLQVVVVDGIKGFYFDLASSTVVEFSGPGWYPAKTVAYQDGYLIFERTGTGQFFITDLLSVTFDPNYYATAEGQPDELVAVVSDHRELILFGSESIEFWYNSGAADFPFERNQGAYIEKGCAARYSVVKQNNTVYFIGSDLMVYQMSGYTPTRISTHVIEETLKGVDLSDAFAYGYQEDGHLFYVLTIPANNITWCFDISTRSWHERRSYQFGRHYSNNAIFFDSKTLVGDFQNGRIYQMTGKYLSDDGQPIVREFILPTVSNGRDYFTLDSFEIDMSSGVGLTTGQGSDPVAQLIFSKDNGKTWSNIKERKIGKRGNYLTRVKWDRLGSARQFVLKVIISDSIPIDIGGCWVEAS
jgi:hypothetical protein